jgi:uncharacterized protein (TIGR02145 family)
MVFFNRQILGRMLLIMTTTVVSSIWSASAQQTGTFTDKRDKQTYKTVTVGGKKWMAENLNVKTGTSWCYGDQESNCKKYGRLYAWSTAAKMACPDGWHLPSQDEWTALTKAAGGTGPDGDGGEAAMKLKSKTDWKDAGGTDQFGFSALPGGSRDGDGDFKKAGAEGYWWTVTQDAKGDAYNRGMYFNYKNVFNYISGKHNGYSVRCVEGEATESVIDVKPKQTKTSDGGSAVAQQKGTFTDGRDKQTYKTTVIGGKTWMAENLRYTSSCPEGDESICMQWCYNDNESNCKKYGKLYTWHTARAVCPKGWKLPTRDEWAALVKAAGGKEVAIKKLKSKSGWNDYCDSEDEDARTCFSGSGTDDYGFSALPGGIRFPDGNFGHTGDFGGWWTATEGSGGDAYVRNISYDGDGVGEAYDDRSYGYSVRCIQE